MITFIGLDRPSAVPSVVIPSHTAKVTTKNDGSPPPPKTPCHNTRSTCSVRLASSVVKENAETLGTECNATPSLRRGTELTLTCGTTAWCIVQVKEMMLDTEHTHTKQHLLAPRPLFWPPHLFLPSSLAPFLLYLATDVNGTANFPTASQQKRDIWLSNTVPPFAHFKGLAVGTDALQDLS